MFTEKTHTELERLGYNGAPGVGFTAVVYRLAQLVDGRWLAYKKFKTAPEKNTVVHFERLVKQLQEWDGRGLAPFVEHHMAWPLAVVTQNGAVCGTVMNYIEFKAKDITASRETDCDLGILCRTDSQILQFYGISINTRIRLELMAQLASVFSFLHKEGFVYGDLNHSNVLWTSSPAPRCVLIDCDVARKKGWMGFKQTLESEGWKKEGAPPKTISYDVWKLSLAVLRVLSIKLSTQRMGDSIEHYNNIVSGVSAGTVKLLQRALLHDDQTVTAEDLEKQLRADAAKAASVPVSGSPGQHPAAKVGSVRNTGSFAATGQAVVSGRAPGPVPAAGVPSPTGGIGATVIRRPQVRASAPSPAVSSPVGALTVNAATGNAPAAPSRRRRVLLAILRSRIFVTACALTIGWLWLREPKPPVPPPPPDPVELTLNRAASLWSNGNQADALSALGGYAVPSSDPRILTAKRQYVSEIVARPRTSEADASKDLLLLKNARLPSDLLDPAQSQIADEEKVWRKIGNVEFHLSQNEPDEALLALLKDFGSQSMPAGASTLLPAMAASLESCATRIAAGIQKISPDRAAALVEKMGTVNESTVGPMFHAALKQVEYWKVKIEERDRELKEPWFAALLSKTREQADPGQLTRDLVSGLRGKSLTKHMSATLDAALLDLPTKIRKMDDAAIERLAPIPDAKDRAHLPGLLFGALDAAATELDKIEKTRKLEEQWRNEPVTAGNLVQRVKDVAELARDFDTRQLPVLLLDTFAEEARMLIQATSDARVQENLYTAALKALGSENQWRRDPSATTLAHMQMFADSRRLVLCRTSSPDDELKQESLNLASELERKARDSSPVRQASALLAAAQIRSSCAEKAAALQTYARLAAPVWQQSQAVTAQSSDWSDPPEETRPAVLRARCRLAMATLSRDWTPSGQPQLATEQQCLDFLSKLADEVPPDMRIEVASYLTIKHLERGNARNAQTSAEGLINRPGLPAWWPMQGRFYLRIAETPGVDAGWAATQLTNGEKRGHLCARYAKIRKSYGTSTAEKKSKLREAISIIEQLKRDAENFHERKPHPELAAFIIVLANDLNKLSIAARP